MRHHLPTSQPANAHHLRVGDMVVTTLQDAYMEASLGLIDNVDEATVAALHAASRRVDPPRITLNAFVVDDGERRVLIDTGLGVMAGDEGARLKDALAAIAVVPDDIDTVLLTHGHPDHLGGLIRDDDTPAFGQAEICVPGGELDFWLGRPPANASDRLTQQFAAAKRVLGACEDRIRRLEGREVMPGITRVPLPGHTPDHSGYRIESAGERLLIAADIVHLPQIQFPRPDAAVAFDVDPDLARHTREELFATLADSGELIAGHHIDFPAVGRVVADGSGYRFLPHVWSPFV